MISAGRPRPSCARGLSPPLLASGQGRLLLGRCARSVCPALRPLLPRLPRARGRGLCEQRGGLHFDRALLRPLCPARFLQMGKPDAAGGGDQPSAAPPTRLRRTPASPLGRARRSKASLGGCFSSRAPAPGRRGADGAPPGSPPCARPRASRTARPGALRSAGLRLSASRETPAPRIPPGTLGRNRTVVSCLRASCWPGHFLQACMPAGAPLCPLDSPSRLSFF